MTTTTLEEGLGLAMESGREGLFSLVVGNFRSQECKRTRGKKLRLSEKARWKAGEKGLVRRQWRKGLRRLVQQEEPEDFVMTGPADWMVEEQECPAEEAMRKLNIQESRPGIAEVQEVLRMMKDLRIDRVDYGLWQRNEHQWLEEFDIVMVDGLRTNC